MPAQYRYFFSRCRLPETNGLVGGTGGEAFAVGTVGQRADGAFMPAQGADRRTGRHVPDVDGAFIFVHGSKLISRRADDRQLPTPRSRRGPGHHGAGAVELAVQVSPLPVAVLRWRPVEGPLGHAAVLELHGRR